MDTNYKCSTQYDGRTIEQSLENETHRVLCVYYNVFLSLFIHVHRFFLKTECMYSRVYLGHSICVAFLLINDHWRSPIIVSLWCRTW